MDVWTWLAVWLLLWVHNDLLRTQPKQAEFCPHTQSATLKTQLKGGQLKWVKFMANMISY